MTAESLPDREPVLVRGAWVLTMGEPGHVRDGALLVRDGEIAAVDTYGRLASRHPDVPVVGDGTGLVVPGFVNAHTHLSESLVPGMGEDLSLFVWGQRIVTPVGAVLTEEHAREGAILKSAEMLRSGVTTVNDMFVHSNPDEMATLGVVDGLEAVGLRGVVSFGAEDAAAGVSGQGGLPVDRVLAEHHRLAERTRAAELVGFRLGVGTILGQSDALLQAGVEHARHNGWGVHTHLAEVREENTEAELRWGRRTIEHCASIGLLELGVVAGHVIWVTETDVELLAHHEVAAVHNPVANMILASGVCPAPRLRTAGIPVALGTDGAASNDSQNMLEAVKAAPLLAKIHALDPRVLTARDALAMATIEGARALGLDRLVGSLEVGKRADVVHLSGNRAELAAIHDPYQQLVYCTNPSAVSDVWVDGRRLLDAGEPTTVDEPRQVVRCRPLARTVAEAAGLTESGVSWIGTS